MTQAIEELEEEVLDLQSKATEYVQDNVTFYNGGQLPGDGNRGRGHTGSDDTNALSQDTASETDDVAVEAGNAEGNANLQEGRDGAEDEEDLCQCDSPGAECCDMPPAPAVGRAAEESVTSIRGYRGDKAILDQMDIDSRWIHQPLRIHATLSPMLPSCQSPYSRVHVMCSPSSSYLYSQLRILMDFCPL